MSYTVQYTRRAITNLQEIYDYISENNMPVADKVIDEIDGRVANLEQMSVKYPTYPDKSAYRRMPVGNYLVFYKIFKDRKIVRVYLVIQGKRRFAAMPG